MTKREAKVLARKTLASVEERIASALAFITETEKRFRDLVAPSQLSIAIALDEGAEARTILGKEWKTWATSVVPGSTATVYRWRNAGMVARILRGEPLTEDVEENGKTKTVPVLNEDGSFQYPDNLLAAVPFASHLTLVPLYRILTAAKTEEAKAAAPSLVRETWEKILAECDEDEDEDGNPFRVAPDPETVLAAAETVAPSNRSGGSSAAADSSDEDEDGDEDEDEGDEDEGTGSAGRADSSSLVIADAAAVEAAAGPTESIVKQQAREYGVSETAVAGIMLAALRLAAEHGVSTVQAILARPSAEEETTEETTEETPAS